MYRYGYYRKGTREIEEKERYSKREIQKDVEIGKRQKKVLSTEAKIEKIKKHGSQIIIEISRPPCLYTTETRSICATVYSVYTT